jgi:hypothetical protein
MRESNEDGVEAIYRRHGRDVSVWVPASGRDLEILAAEMADSRRVRVMVHRDGAVTEYVKEVV